MFIEVYGDTALTDKCREWFRCFKDGDFSVEDKPRLWTAKKIRRQRIRGITRRRSELNVRACRIIEDNSTSCTIESHGNDSKTRKLGAL